MTPTPPDAARTPAGHSLRRILLSGLDDSGWADPPEWSVTRVPLSDAGYLLDYDLLVVKPTLLGGLLPPNLPHADLPTAAGLLARQLFDLRIASMAPKVVIIPAKRGQLRWSTPGAPTGRRTLISHALDIPPA